jgi:hypothetical protein
MELFSEAFNEVYVWSWSVPTECIEQDRGDSAKMYLLVNVLSEFNRIMQKRLDLLLRCRSWEWKAIRQ